MSGRTEGGRAAGPRKRVRRDSRGAEKSGRLDASCRRQSFDGVRGLNTEQQLFLQPLPEFIDPVFAKTSPKRAFSMTKNERFGLVFTKTGSINSDTGHIRVKPPTS